MHKYEPVIQSKRSEKRLELLKAIAIVITVLLIGVFLTGCANVKTEKPRENCRYTAEFYGDFVECTIKLDELQGEYK